jgi:hypothetical protein
MVVSRRNLGAFRDGGGWDFAEAAPPSEPAQPLQLGSRWSGSRRHSSRPWAS